MPELVLPGVYIEVRPEALIVGGPITVGNIGIVGTASWGPLGVQVLGSYAEARETFGPYDPFETPEDTTPLTLVRALELAYANGASTVLAVRTGVKGAVATAWKESTFNVLGTAGTGAVLTAKFKGSFGNRLTITVADEPAPSTKSTVTLELGQTQEQYSVTNGADLATQIAKVSALVTAVNGGDSATKLKVQAGVPFTGGRSGAQAAATDYDTDLEKLSDENAHIMLAAGQDSSAVIGVLKAHVEKASTDKNKRDRIAIVGSAPRGATTAQAQLTAIQNATNSLSSDRMIFVGPGVETTDAAATPPKLVKLPGSYASAVIAGVLSVRDPHISPTNKTISVAGLETKFSQAQLEQLVTARVLALEDHQGFRIVKGITTDNGAFRQITTRRIVDFAKFGVRSAAEPYIGLLNNDRVRKALKGSINGFLAGMVDDEMLVSYELDVTATRDEEIRGIAKVTMTVRPTFSIDYIKVVMFLG